ncbi:hypothetical protein [Winogradskyella sp. PE311]|uniref:hypothetical protein n=1 Tax=Winogradskyella sp. PE311 TaxID=3366943 RepID=UPI003981624C
MRLLKMATYAIIFGVILSTTYQCASPKATTATFEEQAPFKVKPAYFQEWYAGIKVGGTGINIFLPITDIAKNVQIDQVYFRNLKGKLTKKNGKYYALLKNTSQNYTFTKSEAPADYPFVIGDNECAISYKENGATKYIKVIGLNEVAGTYYENGPPSIYTKSESTGMASLDDEEDDN